MREILATRFILYYTPVSGGNAPNRCQPPINKKKKKKKTLEEEEEEEEEFRLFLS